VIYTNFDTQKRSLTTEIEDNCKGTVAIQARKLTNNKPVGPNLQNFVGGLTYPVAAQCALVITCNGTGGEDCLVDLIAVD
jgi:hypothetical protein